MTVMMMLIQFCNGSCHHRLCTAMAAVNDGGGNGGPHRWRQWFLSTEAMSVFVADGNEEGRRGQGQTRAWG